MRPGSLRSRVVIKQPGATQDTLGQMIPGWTNLIASGDGKVWANIRHLSGLETIKGGAETAIGKASIRIRYRDDVTTAMRVVHGATTYRITAVLPDERKAHLDIACEVID
jgi:SPP1 family predicted phage head-tail adaptor